jgi:hypothetical protein
VAACGEVCDMCWVIIYTEQAAYMHRTPSKHAHGTYHVSIQLLEALALVAAALWSKDGFLRLAVCLLLPLETSLARSAASPAGASKSSLHSRGDTVTTGVRVDLRMMRDT